MSQDEVTSVAAGAVSPPPWRARIRMYRQGLGDCFLVTLNGPEAPFHVLIDCGVILGTANAASQIAKVVADIRQTCDDHIDIVVGTHEHWDHLSGFVQATDDLKKIAFETVWLGWTEDPKDPAAAGLAATRAKAIDALRLGVARLRLAGDGDSAAEIDSILEFFGTAGGSSTKDALEIVRTLSNKPPTYVRPTDAPVDLPGGARLYVLGPPLDPALLKKSSPSVGQSYGFDSVDLFVSDVAPRLTDAGGSPFADDRVIPLSVAEHMPFFRETYFNASESGRKLDAAWLGSLSDVALKLDSDTNNTSVVLAFELPGGDVLLFCADAQIGSWLSWATLSWQVDGRTVTGPDLLKRAIVYKVGHHGSHNATLKPNGLELMTALKYALLPVDAAMAQKKNWGRMPLPEIVDELNRRTGERVLRIDQPKPAAAGPEAVETPLYYELTI